MTKTKKAIAWTTSILLALILVCGGIAMWFMQEKPLADVAEGFGAIDPAKISMIEATTRPCCGPQEGSSYYARIEDTQRLINFSKLAKETKLKRSVSGPMTGGSNLIFKVTMKDGSERRLEIHQGMVEKLEVQNYQSWATFVDWKAEGMEVDYKDAQI